MDSDKRLTKYIKQFKAELESPNSVANAEDEDTEADE